MAWRVARSLDILLGQINKAYPGRSLAADGSIGDAAHASRSSDHNPWVRFPGSSTGIVTARDFTHDPPYFDAHAFAEHLRQARDPRIKYVISNRRIFAGNDGPQPWVWRSYTGANPHTRHIHVSVRPYVSSDSLTPWRMPAADSAAPIRPVTPEDDDMTPDEYRETFVTLMREAAERSTPTGRQLGNYLAAVIAPSVAALVWQAEFGSDPRETAGERLANASEGGKKILGQ